MLNQERPPIWIGHIILPTPDLESTHEFMVTIGMRPIARGEEFAVLELRGGTHLVLVPGEVPSQAAAGFDLMVEDIHATHDQYQALGFAPSQIDKGTIHESFTMQCPSGHIITFNSDHSSSYPV